MLSAVGDRRKPEKLRDRIDRLKIEPEKQGKSLTDNRSGFRSLRAVGQRDRIVDKIERDRVIVVVVGMGRRKEGSRKDIYAL